MMRFTGHPLVDAGVAGITAWAGRGRPEDVTADDLDAWARLSLRLYVTKTADLALNQLFTRNFPYLHPSMAPAARLSQTRDILYAWRDAPVGSDGCAYCGRAALPARVHRDRVPMLEGRDRMNFGPGGQAGLAICGLCLLALQALTLACPVARGRATVLETPDDRLRLDVYRLWVREGVERAERSLLTGEKIVAPTTPLTQAVSALSAVFGERDLDVGVQAELRGGATVYALTNSGQGPMIDIWSLGLPLVEWIRRAQGPRLRSTWRLCAGVGAGGAERWGDDVGQLPNGLGGFWRRRITPAGRVLRGLPARRQGARPRPGGRGRRATRDDGAEADQRPGYDLNDVELGGLARALLEGVVGVRAERLAALQRLADRLGEEIAGQEDVRLYREMFQRNVRYYSEMRQLLLRANARRTRRGDGPIVGLADFVLAFDEGPDEEPMVDWRLGWDLILIGVTENLYRERWFQSHAQVVAVEEQTDADTDADADAGVGGDGMTVSHGDDGETSIDEGGD